MIIPSIDLLGGQAVQLVGGAEPSLELGDPLPLAERFGVVGELAVVDLDAALGSGSNAELVTRLLRLAPCRVGGGIRDVASAVRWLDAGAERVVLGTAAVPEVLRELPAERVIAALDARDGEVVVDGWRRRTGRSVVERMRELEGLVGGFLVTFVEREGRLQGLDLARVAEVLGSAAGTRVTVAGGIRSAEEIAAVDALGADAQVGMALHTGHLELGDAVAATLRSDRPDGLWPTVVVDEGGVALGLAYSDGESLREALRTRRGVYRSRERGLWVKGATSGATQDLLRVDADCDRDALRFTVRQHGAGFCHLARRSCFGDEHGLRHLSRRLSGRAADAPPGSYTRRLLAAPALLRAKLVEEAGELADAVTGEAVAAEAADLLYFALVALARGGVPLEAVEAVLDLRERRVTRRPGGAKPG
jgi:phosphoribosyl-AMP cyclohydrolase / phosphoribosyl-ATP pyrophosphohydrolase